MNLQHLGLPWTYHVSAQGILVCFLRLSLALLAQGSRATDLNKLVGLGHGQ